MRNEYPRPELVREKWFNLNGEWDFEFDFGNSGLYNGDTENVSVESTYKTLAFTKKINVPFCPESKLSGIGYTDFINACWYKKSVKLPKDFSGRILLHFEAAFYHTSVLINGKFIGSHAGGYTPFTFDITDEIKDGEFEIAVHCAGDSRDGRQPSGKQSAKRDSFGCYYTRSTGIWQTVWLECVSETYLKSIKLDGDTDNKKLCAEIGLNKLGKKKITLTAYFDKKEVGKTTLKSTLKTVNAEIKLKVLKTWNIGDPNLYDLKIEIQTEKGTDTVSSYFGMRKLELDKTGLIINGKRVMQRLVLDQGYYMDGIYTAPTAEDLEKDIKLSMRMGFNGARLHQKVFERRFLYLCDKLGYIAWGEYPSWGFDHSQESGFLYYLPEWLEAVERDYNHPSIITWCPLNENWTYDKREQRDALVKQIYLETKRYDKFRPVIDVSWNYHVMTDIYDVHEYTQDQKWFRGCYHKFNDGTAYKSINKAYTGEPYAVSEYGGMGWSKDGKGWGYGNNPKTEKEFEDRYIGFIESMFLNPRICSICYTQLYDVEQEINGIYNYDRTPKFGEDMMDRMKDAMEKKSAYEKFPVNEK